MRFLFGVLLTTTITLLAGDPSQAARKCQNAHDRDAILTFMVEYDRLSSLSSKHFQCRYNPLLCARLLVAIAAITEGNQWTSPTEVFIALRLSPEQRSAAARLLRSSHRRGYLRVADPTFERISLSNLGYRSVGDFMTELGTSVTNLHQMLLDITQKR